MPHGVLSFLLMTIVQFPDGSTLTQCLETSLLCAFWAAHAGSQRIHYALRKVLGVRVSP